MLIQTRADAERHRREFLPTGVRANTKIPRASRSIRREPVPFDLGNDQNRFSPAAPPTGLVKPSRKLFSTVFLIALALALACMVFFGGKGRHHARSSSTSEISSVPPAAFIVSDDETTAKQIRLFSQRAQRDPEDFVAQNMLAGAYLQRLRETSTEDYLPLALAAARASLASVPAERNFGGLMLLAQAEFANHGFAEARSHAQQLTVLNPQKSEGYQLLGDALLELGDYDNAATAFEHLQKLEEDSAGTETRLARLALLRGQVDVARQRFSSALGILLSLSAPPRDAIAWCRWQLGETAFSVGDYATAERHYRDALITAPGDFRATASLGRLYAAREDWPAASAHYQKALRAAAVHESVAALGDIFKMRGRNEEAASLYEMVEQMAEHTLKVHGTTHNRNLALFYADHDMNPEQAYALAAAEYATRKDIYGADALAWTALKAGRIEEAQSAIKNALRLGTQDAKLFYHAGMIAHARRDETAARGYLKRALALNPQFDALQARRARSALRN